MKTHSIIRARYVEKLKLELTFSDLTSQLVDFEKIFPLEDLYKNQISKGSTKITRTA